KEYQKPQPERPVIELSQAASAGSNLRGTAYNRLVTFTATFEKNYIAEDQKVTLADGTVARKDILVSLARLSDQRAVLVARQVYDGKIPTISGEVIIHGRLYPRQNEDHALGGKGKLSRIDPALVAGEKGFTLFDGYVLQTDNGLAAPQLLSRAGAFYWQHIAYVVTWWFMALLVLTFPFYNRFKERVGE
ncbi:MAG: hypothetical protein RL414_1234, partial [Actinomycetota bacterium]